MGFDMVKRPTSVETKKRNYVESGDKFVAQGKINEVGATPAKGRTSGTSVSFWPDPTIFASEGTEFVARTVLERLQTMAFLNRGLEINFVDEREGKAQKVTFQYTTSSTNLQKKLGVA